MKNHLRWDDIRCFMTAADTGSIRAAAQKLTLSASTVAARIKVLENATGRILLTRSNDGVRLTHDGRIMMKSAQKMQEASIGADRMLRSRQKSLKGEVKVTVTEGLGTFWVAPRLVEFGNRHPELTVNLNCNMVPPDIRRYEADIAIQLTRPSDLSLLIKRIGYIHIMPFASQDYIRHRGVPSSIKEWPRHYLVEQVSDQILPLNLEENLNTPNAVRFVKMRTNTSTAHYWAVAKGAGIGLLPTYIQAISSRVIPIDVGINLRREVWMVCHPDARKIKSVDAVMKWLEEGFSGKIYPWFAEQFIHPNDMAETLRQAVAVQLFEGFIERHHN